MMSCAPTMVQDILGTNAPPKEGALTGNPHLDAGTTMPEVADERFCQNYVVSIACFNLMGRFGWASVSDWIGTN